MVSTLDQHWELIPGETEQKRERLRPGDCTPPPPPHRSEGTVPAGGLSAALTPRLR